MGGAVRKFWDYFIDDHFEDRCKYLSNFVAKKTKNQDFHSTYQYIIDKRKRLNKH